MISNLAYIELRDDTELYVLFIDITFRSLFILCLLFAEVKKIGKGPVDEITQFCFINRRVSGSSSAIGKINYDELKKVKWKKKNNSIDILPRFWKHRRIFEYRDGEGLSIRPWICSISSVTELWRVITTFSHSLRTI